MHYVSGAMTAAEREGFDVVLEFHRELQAHVAGLQDVVATLVMARVAPVAAPPATLKSRLLSAAEDLMSRPEPDALVVTQPDGRLEWANSVFTAMCGYSLAELQGRKPGHLLQGPETDPAVVQRIRASLRANQACRETLLNYHKDGTRYRADVRIMPVLDDEGRPLWFVAKERKLALIGNGGGR